MMKTAPLGKNDPATSRVGFGAMTLDGLYGAAEKDAATVDIKLDAQTLAQVDEICRTGAAIGDTLL